jgi:flagellar biosynthesis protein FlhF
MISGSPSKARAASSPPRPGLDVQAQQQVELLTRKPLVSTQARPAKAEAAAADADMMQMMRELKDMRHLMQAQLAEMSWNRIQQREPVKAEILSRLLAAGFSAALARQLAEKMPPAADLAAADKWLQVVLAQNLRSMADENGMLERGGVFALIGPTGAGKTTTTAKLAARYVMKHGPNRLALITTDAYRIGGHEQLRIYGKILGVMVHAVKDQADLSLALNELKQKHTVLIDTVGVSQRDSMVAEQIAMLHGADRNIKKLLCLNATSTGETLADVLQAYKGRGLEGAVITKLDEAATTGSVLDILIREKLRLYYVANGQRVPEDLHLANSQFLVHQALRLGQQRPAAFGLQPHELPLVMERSDMHAAGGGIEVGHA